MSKPMSDERRKEIEHTWGEASNALDNITEWLEHHEVLEAPGWASKSQMLEQLKSAADGIHLLWDCFEEIDRLKEDVRIAREAARLLVKNEEDIFKKLDAAKEQNRKARELLESWLIIVPRLPRRG